MPFINMSTNADLTAEKITELKQETGRIIEVIPGKNESQLMLQINTNQNMFFKGEAVPCMMIQVNCYGQAEKSDLEAFVKELSEAVEKITAVPKENIYLTVDGYGNWGAAGRYI